MNNTDSDSAKLNLIYDYTKKLFDDGAQAIVVTNTKLSTIIAFSGVLLKFSAELSIPESSQVTDSWVLLFFIAIKILCCSFCILALAYGFWGLYNQPDAGVASPQSLVKRFNKSEQELRAIIIRTWEKGIEKRKNLGVFKGECLYNGMIFLTIGSVFFGISIIFGTILSYIRQY